METREPLDSELEQMQAEAVSTIPDLVLPQKGDFYVQELALDWPVSGPLGSIHFVIPAGTKVKYAINGAKKARWVAVLGIWIFQLSDDQSVWIRNASAGTLFPGLWERVEP